MANFSKTPKNLIKRKSVVRKVYRRRYDMRNSSQTAARRFGDIYAVLAVLVICSLYILIFGQSKPRTVSASHPRIGKHVWTVYNGVYQLKSVDGLDSGWKESSSGKALSQFVPIGGFYSSRDPSKIKTDFKTISDSGIDSIIFPWTPYPSHGSSNELLHLLFDQIKLFPIRIGVMIQNYENRSAETILDDIYSYINEYSTNPSILSFQKRTVIIVYDAHLIENAIKIYKNLSSLTFPPLLLATGVEQSHFSAAYENGFDGFVTFYANEGFTWGSSAENWPLLQKIASNKGAVFVPTIGPGYNDSISNPWNIRYSRARDSGNYYKSRWSFAIDSGADVILINSFNNFAEGTEIEPSTCPDEDKSCNYVWGSSDPNFYVNITKEWSKKFKEERKSIK